MSSAQKHQITQELIRKVVVPPLPDSHKGQNGKILIIGGSPLFHGAGRLAAKSAMETIISFSSRTNDMVYYCSTKQNLDYLKLRQDCFIGITRDQVDSYLKVCDVVLVGCGLMREPEINWPETNKEPLVTRQLTAKVLQSGKKAVLDAGSLQVIKPEQLKGKNQVIIAPHRIEMANLFKLDPTPLILSHDSAFSSIQRVAHLVQKVSSQYQITILLKGPIDVIANQTDWFYSTGGNAGMTKGGTGDVLAGITASLYSRHNNPLIAASAASFICKKTAGKLWRKKQWLYNAEDLVNQLNLTIKALPNCSN